MSYKRWREEFISEAAQNGYRYQEATAMLRAATSLQRSSEIQCSIDVGEKELARLERRDAAAEKRVTAIVTAHGHSVEFQGDPRGCPFTIKVKPEGQSWTRSISCPGLGLPARCFA